MNTAQKMKLSIKGLCSKSDQIRRKLQTWSHLLRKSFMENFIFCAIWNFLLSVKIFLQQNPQSEGNLKKSCLKVLEKLAQKYLRQRAIVNAVAGCWSGIVLKLHFVSIMVFTYVKENRGYRNWEYRNNFFLLDMIIDYRLLVQIVPGITLNMSSYSVCILDASDQLRLRAFTVR